MSGEMGASNERTPEPPTPRLYAASLSDYNAGILHGCWIDATLEPTELQEAIDQMLRASPTTRRYGDVAEEWAIHDYEGFGPVALGEFEDLNSLHALAEGIATHGDAFAAWWALESRSDEDHTEIAQQFENAYVGEYDSLEAYGEQLLEELGIDLDNLPLPEGLRPYIQIDVASWTRDLEIDGGIATAESGRGVFVFWNTS